MDQYCIVIPARLESGRVNQKLLLKIADKSCIERTVQQCMKTSIKKIFVFTDSQKIIDSLKDYKEIDFVLTDTNCRNGTERISKYLYQIPERYKYIVNVQADDPFIDPINIDFAVNRHVDETNLFYTTLHQESTDEKYIRSTSSVKLVTDSSNNVLLYSRSVIPGNKKNEIKKTYKLFTGIYVFNRELLAKYYQLEDTPLQLEEDVEQLKILEHGFKIKSYPTKVYNEISLNTPEDYQFLLNKYVHKNVHKKEKAKIRLVVFDLDGVFTDCKFYVSESMIFKNYNGKDSYALKILKDKNIKTGIITAHETGIVKNMEFIFPRLDFLSMGKMDKLPVLNEWLEKEGLTYEEVAYIGDDIPDIAILEKVGFSACPADAVDEVKQVVKHVCKNKGGDGAVREFVNMIIDRYSY